MNSTQPGMQPADLPRWLWLWFPPMILLAHGVTWVFGIEFHRAVMRSEFGLVENLTFVFLLVAVLFGLLNFSRRKQVGNPWFSSLILLLTAGCCYFAGEEVSWGHHWGLHPFSQEYRAALISMNDQAEPNLHNQGGLLGSLLDNVPRNLLSLAALIGGILGPLWARKRRAPTWPSPWVWPTTVCMPTCILALVVTQPRRIIKLVQHEEVVGQMWRLGETKEYFLALFLMLYMASIHRRLRHMAIAS